MPIAVDARGLACPEPVVRTRKALLSESEVEVLVDNDTAMENIKRLGESIGCLVKIENLSAGEYRINILKNELSAEVDIQKNKQSAAGPTIVVIQSDTMGKGDDELGQALMKAFLHTLSEMTETPEMVILYNSGVKLALKETQSSGDLIALIEKGSQVLVCGTCVNFFEIKDRVSAGTISNMYDIASALMTSGRIVCP